MRRDFSRCQVYSFCSVILEISQASVRELLPHNTILNTFFRVLNRSTLKSSLQILFPIHVFFKKVIFLVLIFLLVLLLSLNNCKNCSTLYVRLTYKTFSTILYDKKIKLLQKKHATVFSPCTRTAMNTISGIKS